MSQAAETTHPSTPVIQEPEPERSPELALQFSTSTPKPVPDRVYGIPQSWYIQSFGVDEEDLVDEIELTKAEYESLLERLIQLRRYADA